MIYVYRIFDDDTDFLVLRSLSATMHACWFSNQATSFLEALARVFGEDSYWYAPNPAYALRGKTYELLTTASDIDELRTNYPELFI